MSDRIEIQGHRGWRGSFPENTLLGFARTLALGVDAIEFDVGMSADDELVIVHDRSLSPDIFRSASGAWLSPPYPTVRSLSLEELQQFDVGRLRPDSAYAARFPNQAAIDGLRVPTLRDYVSLLQDMRSTDVGLNIEVKISPLHPEETAAPDYIVNRLLEVLDDSDTLESSVIQSFDWRVVTAVHQSGTQVRTSCLSIETADEDTIGQSAGDSPWTGEFAIRDTNGSVPALVNAAGADVWAPWFGDLTCERVAEAHSLGLRVITWTVNETNDIETMIDYKVDGIISDYPERLRNVITKHGHSLPIERELAGRYDEANS